MTRLTPPITLLGVPVVSLTMDQTVDEILQLIDQYGKDKRPHYVATINVDFLVKVTRVFSTESCFPELLYILRRSSLATIDGMPLVWLSYLLGSPAKERVTGVDLLPKLAEALRQRNQAIFLLGGEERTLKLTVLYLQALYPGLRIVGASHPHIHVEGEQLENAEERDALLIEQINYAAPDLLFLNLGNPKQELWFERVRKKLHVPVTIGVGGAFDMLTGTVSRAPLWMQRVGLEWLFRLFQEPRRLFKRYVVDAFKFPSIALPLVLFHNFNRWRHQLRHWGREKNLALPNPLLFISTHQTITVVPLPTRIDKLVSLEIKDASDDFFNQDVIVLDFQHVGHLDLEGLGLLLYLWERAAKEKKQLFALGVKRNIHKLLSLHRLLDCMRPYMCPTTQDIMARLIPNGHSSGVYDSIQQQHNHVIISFFGCLDNRQDYTVYIKKIAPILHKKTCILDLTYCSYIDNTGIAFLLMLHKIQPDHFVSLKIAGMSKIIRKQLRMAGVLSFFG